MDIFEGIDWEALGELIEPVIGLAIALLFMGFMRLRKSSRRRSKAAAAKVPPVATPRLERPTPKGTVGSEPIEPGDDAAKLSKRYSQSSSR